MKKTIQIKADPTISIQYPEAVTVIEKELDTMWMQLQSEIPSILYHYTGTEGFVGITSIEKLWLTDIDYLADTHQQVLNLSTYF